MASLCDAGLIRHLGISNARPSHLAEAQAIAREHEATPAQVRLAWALHRGPHVLMIPGTGTPDHLVDNISAGPLRLTADDVRRLDALHRRVG